MRILGNGGFAREVASIMCDIYGFDPQDLSFFEDKDGTSAVTKSLQNGGKNYGHYIGVGSPKLKKIWAQELEIQNLYSPVLQARTARILDWNKSTKIGEGTILCDGVLVTTNVNVGKFVTLNLNVTVGHDTTIGDYTTIAPGSNISGNVKIGECVDVGSNAVIIPGVEIPDNMIIGAGSVVLKTPQLPENYKNGVMVGSPARIIKINGVRV